MSATKSATKSSYQLTPEQLILREQRKLKRLEVESASASENNGSTADVILRRPWISLIPDKYQSSTDAILRVKILTFNVGVLHICPLLAQCLVRRELFPTSQCLKASQREPMIHQELLAQNPDIMCLQEVDRLDKITAMLESSDYSHIYAAGQSKNHGCLIAFKRSKFTKLSHHLVNYDQEEIRVDGDSHTRRGRTFRTRNIGLLLALKNIDADNGGILVATTHMFWHPKYDYERARQAGILLREITKYRSTLQIGHWPCIMAGDFNFSPSDPAYALMVGEPLSDEHKSKILESQVVHVSVDPSWQKTRSIITSNDEEEGIDPDCVITNARVATPSDGLLSISELEGLYVQGVQLKSIYDIGLRESRRHSKQSFKTFGDRVPLSLGKCGSYEPEYTSYTHYWKTVLDYIFVLDPAGSQCQLFGLLATHCSEDLEPGLPKHGVCGSDHISLVAELGWLFPNDNAA